MTEKQIYQHYIVKRTFWLGTDRFGRDMLSRLIIGTRISLAVGFIAVLISLWIGVILGSLSAYYGGVTDMAITWLINVIWAIPTLLLVFAITSVLGKGFWLIFIAVGCTMWVGTARLIRGQVLSIKELEYIQVARTVGYSSFRIIFVHILPNIMGHAYVLVPPQNVKVVILGQDPYHNPGEAMGLCFSVPHGINIPPSLKNIYKELNEDLACRIPGHGDLTKWANQGVFLLNAILTVEKNQPGSPGRIGWQQFTDQTISYLSDHFDHIVFMLWGNFARSKRLLINPDRHLILEAAHPSPLARNAFQGCRHFSKANHYLSTHGKPEVDWSL